MAMAPEHRSGFEPRYARSIKRTRVLRSIATLDAAPGSIRFPSKRICKEPRCHSGAYDWALTCDLPDWEAMDRYMWHEAHIRTMPFAQDVVEYLESFDFEIGFEAPEPATDHPASEPAAAGLSVPDVRGRTEADARAVLAGAGLEAEAEVRTVLGAAWAPGRVLATRPRPGAEIAPGSPVALTVAGEWWSKPDFSAMGPRA